MTEHNRLTENATDQIRRHRDVVRGHDAVHPDRDDCGGVGGCNLLATEVQARDDIIDTLELIARGPRGVQVVLA